MATKDRDSRSAASGHVLDAAARYRRQMKALELLEQDNSHEEPHAGLVMNKKLAKLEKQLFSDPGVGAKKKRERDPKYYTLKYRTTLDVLVKEVQVANPEGPNYSTVAAPPSKLPPRSFCSVCGFEAPYKCIACGSRFCCIKCSQTHKETRCLKCTA